MGGSGRVRTPVHADDLIQETILKVIRSQKRAVELAPHAYRSEEVSYWISLKIAFHIALFLAAFSFIQKTLFLSSGFDLRKLKDLRDRIKSLNPPVKLIPQSLHPIESAAL